MTNDGIEVRCWACGASIVQTFGPGRPKRWCNSDCKNKARAEKRRLEVLQAQRLARKAYRDEIKAQVEQLKRDAA